jgi:hypothetical protein
MSNKDKTYFTPDGSPVAPDLFDVRVRTQYLSRGKVSPEELKSYLASLPDEAENAEARPLEQILGDESPENLGGSSGVLTH